MKTYQIKYKSGSVDYLVFDLVDVSIEDEFIVIYFFDDDKRLKVLRGISNIVVIG